jgi:hypothetical protein
MNSDKKQILQMLADGKLNPDEAERLLAALDGHTPAEASDAEENDKCKPKFLIVKVNSEPGSNRRHENVNIKIPLVLLKAGVKLGSLLPESAKSQVTTQLADHGIALDVNKLDAEKLQGLIDALCESSIDVDTDTEKVKIYCA